MRAREWKESIQKEIDALQGEIMEAKQKEEQEVAQVKATWQAYRAARSILKVRLEELLEGDSDEGDSSG